jgi:hypothetical protein
MQIKIPQAGLGIGTYNHRIIRHADGEDSILMIHEVHYDAAGTCRGWSQDGVAVSADSLEGCKEVLVRMARALLKPILVERQQGERTVLVDEITGLPVRGTAVADLPSQKRAELEALAGIVEKEAACDSDETLQ